MRRFNLLSLMCLVLLFAASSATVRAQKNPPPDEEMQQTVPPQPRPNLMAQLGLTQDQIKQIRQINQAKKPQMRAAQDRLREANRTLDQAIYADVANDVEIQARLKDVQTAHAEVIKIRSLTELAVRKILSPDQLAKFREVREKFAEQKENMQQQQQLNNRRMNAPNRRNNLRNNILKNNLRKPIKNQ